MDNAYFDRITRIFATSSRRRATSLLAAGVLTSLLPRSVAAVCSPADCDQEFPCGFKACDKITCRTHFSPAGTLCRPAGGSCDVAERCTGNSLDCPTDRAAPDGTPCPDDGNPCTGDVCLGSLCAHPAMPNGTNCPDDGNPCTDDVCQRGVCAHPNKADGATCAPGKVCQAGTCQCAPGSDMCGEICTALESDPSNCGACGLACANGEACCRGTCARLSNDESNCGRCGKRCRNGQRCRKGRCRKS